MNKTVIFMAYAVLVALGFTGSVLVILIAPEQFGTLTGFLVVLLGLVTTTAVTFWGLNKAKTQINEQSEKLDVVQKQTNGTLSRLISLNDEKTLIIHHKDSEIAKRDIRIAELETMVQHPPITKGRIQND